MVGFHSLPLRYTIDAPIGRVLPIVPLLLDKETRFRLDREPGSEVAWRLHRLLDDRAVGRLVLRSVDPNHSELLAAPAGSNGHRSRPSDIAPALTTMISRLQDYGFTVAPVDRMEPVEEPAPVVLLVVPPTPFFRGLAARLNPIAAEHGYALRRPPQEADDDPASVARDVEAATVVIADLSTERGWEAAHIAAARDRMVVAVAPVGAEIPEPWHARTLFYGENPAQFVRALGDRIAASAPTDRVPTMVVPAEMGDETAPQAGEGSSDRTEPDPARPSETTEPAPAVAPREESPAVFQQEAEVEPAVVFPEEPVEPPPLPALLSTAPDEARRVIYRATALDPNATPERRFHAARVLAAYGDRDAAAVALGAVARSATPLRDEALTMLGTLGPAARVALWALDASEENPERSVAIARQLHASGDTTTARLRLERLARHPDREVRLAALHALADLGAVAHHEFTRLLHAAEDPRMRLEAARWLRLQGLELDMVIETLSELANRTDHVPVALDALHELRAVKGPKASEALVNLAMNAKLSDMRLAAAQALGKRGETEVAREALLAIAEGQDEHAATSATEALMAFGESVPSDTERLMLGAALNSVRRRAAAQLIGPEQPETVQQQAARVLLVLGRPEQALPALSRLALSAENGNIRRWAAEQLANLGASAVPSMMEVLEATEDRAIGLRIAQAILRVETDPLTRRKVAAWLAAHDSGPQAAQVLVELALEPNLGEGDAHAALNDLIRLSATHPAAVRGVSQLVREASPVSVRRDALDFLLRNHVEELPLSTLVDLAVREQSPADLVPLLRHLPEVATPVAQRVIEETLRRGTSPARRWRLLNLLAVLPQHVAVSALRQLAARAPDASMREVAAERLLAAGAAEAALPALASLAQSAAHPEVRRRAMYRLQQAGSVELLRAVAAQSPYADARELATHLLRELGADAPGLSWRERFEQWVARLPLGWLDRLLGAQ